MAADSAALAKHFSYFADHEVTDDPLYVALCRHVAARPDLLELMQHAPPTQRVPNLLLASVHDRVLAGVPHALREYFPSAGGTRAPDAAICLRCSTTSSLRSARHCAGCWPRAARRPTRSAAAPCCGRHCVRWRGAPVMRASRCSTSAAARG